MKNMNNKKIELPKVLVSLNLNGSALKVGNERVTKRVIMSGMSEFGLLNFSWGQTQIGFQDLPVKWKGATNLRSPKDQNLI